MSVYMEGAARMQPMNLPPLRERPLVSVLIGNYNYARYIAATLDSVAVQTYTNFEVIVCDDGSTDNSREIIGEFPRKDGRFKLVVRENGGQTAALNEAYRHATGDIVCFLDSDDTFDPDKLASIVAAFHADPSAGMCTHYLRVVDTMGQPLLDRTPHFLDSGWLGPTTLLRGAAVFAPNTSALSLRRQVSDCVFPISLTIVMDADGYMNSIVPFLTRVTTVNRILASYRVHGKNGVGLVLLTPGRLAKEMKMIETRHFEACRFLASRYPPSIAAKLKLEDNPFYLQTVLKARALGHTSARSDWGSARQIIRRLGSRHWRRFWQLMFAIPEPARAPAVRLVSQLTTIKNWLIRSRMRPAPAPRGA